MSDPVKPLNREQVETLVECWCQRLENNTDKQGFGVLERQTGEMCCLGVLLHVAMEKFPELPIERVTEGNVYSFNKSCMSIEETLVSFIGLNGSEGRYVYDNEGNKRYLTNANDNDRKTFPEIAQIIRAHKTELFPILKENPCWNTKDTP